MPAIAIVDDRKDARETIQKTIGVRLHQERDWEVLETVPLADMNEYPSWIAGNDISVLILDERLHEEAEKGCIPVDYEGHDLVEFIRDRYDTLPIFILTSYPDDEDLKQKFADVEEIIERKKFDPDKYVPRFIRSGSRFYQEHRQELERLAELSIKIAKGEATPEEIKEVRGIQFHKALPLAPLITRTELLDQLESVVNQYEELGQRIRQHLEGQQNNEVVQDRQDTN